MPRREQRQRRRDRRQDAQSAATPNIIQKYRGWVIGGGVGSVIAALVIFGLVQSVATEEDFGFTAYGPTDTLGISERSGEFAADILAQGKPVVLNFWGGTCPPCRAEMPDFQAAFNDFGDQAIFLGLDVGPFTGLGTRSDAESLLQELGISYPTAYPDGDPTRDFSIVGLPQTIFYDAAGNRVAREGFLSGTRMNRIMTSTLGLTPTDEIGS
ncbi:MAG: TlpA disulfide reductase family protein [Chloroflexi bacterium]|nr:TlpA disulfide reductase family protein [Chloroflexota bacterium]